MNPFISFLLFMMLFLSRMGSFLFAGKVIKKPYPGKIKDVAKETRSVDG